MPCHRFKAAGTAMRGQAPSYGRERLKLLLVEGLELKKELRRLSCEASQHVI